MAETSKATVAGVCDIVAGICGLVGGLPLLVLALVGSGVLAALPEAEVRPLAIIPLGVDGVGPWPDRSPQYLVSSRSELQQWSSPSSPSPSSGPRAKVERV